VPHKRVYPPCYASPWGGQMTKQGRLTHRGASRQPFGRKGSSSRMGLPEQRSEQKSEPQSRTALRIVTTALACVFVWHSVALGAATWFSVGRHMNIIAHEWLFVFSGLTLFLYILFVELLTWNVPGLQHLNLPLEAGGVGSKHSRRLATRMERVVGALCFIAGCQFILTGMTFRFS
jgi:hypothetical protein